MLQPRRAAARFIARRIAAERGWTLGKEVGWHVRFERRFERRHALAAGDRRGADRTAAAGPSALGLRDDRPRRVSRAKHSRRPRHRPFEAGDGSPATTSASSSCRRRLRPSRVASYLGPCEVDPRARPTPSCDGCTRAAPLRGRRRAAGPSRGQRERALLSARRTRNRPHDCRSSSARARRHRHRSPSWDTHCRRAGSRVDAGPGPSRDRCHKHRRDQHYGAWSNGGRGCRGREGCEVRRGPRDRQPRDRADHHGGGGTARRSRRTYRARYGLSALEPVRSAPTLPRAEIHRVDLSGVLLDIAGWGGDPRTLDWFDRPRQDALDAAIALLNRMGALHGTD